MRSTLLALSLLLSSAAYAADQAPAGDVPPKDVKADEKKPDPDTVKASVEEDAQPVKRSIPFHGHTLSYVVTPGHLTVRNDKGFSTTSFAYVIDDDKLWQAWKIEWMKEPEPQGVRRVMRYCPGR